MAPTNANTAERIKHGESGNRSYSGKPSFGQITKEVLRSQKRRQQWKGGKTKCAQRIWHWITQQHQSY
jgi:hypothetical protein